MMKYLFLVIFAIVSLSAEHIKLVKDGIESTLSSDGTKTIRIALNHNQSFRTQIKLSGVSPSFSMDLPIANRWKIIRAKAVIKYTPSMSLSAKRSFMNVQLDDNTLKQFQLLKQKFIDIGESKVEIEIPHQNLEPHNKFKIQIYQHYLDSGKENMGNAPEVWTQINLKDSYIELKVNLKKIKKELSEIVFSVFDTNNPLKHNINYVFHEEQKSNLFNYAFFSSILGKILPYNKIDMSISHNKILADKDNLIIATTENLKKIFDKNGFGFQIQGNINIFPNPQNNKVAIIIITAKTEKRLKEVLFSTFGLGFSINSSNNKIVQKVIFPKPAQAYSSPEYLSAGRSYLFKDFKYKTKTFQGYYAEPLNINFKLYPDLFFKNKVNGDIDVNYIFPLAIQDDSVTNIFVNDNFVSQIKMLDARDSKTIKQYLKLDNKTSSKYPASFLKGGLNNLQVSMRMMPLKNNSESLKATILDNSFFQIPEAVHWIGMANLKDFTSSAFPFSIYPDLQDTFFLLTDNTDSTIEAVMQISKFLGENIQYPPYYLKIGTSINSDNKNKNIIMIGKYNNTYSEIYKKAPLILTKQGYIRDIDLEHHFTDSLEEIEKKEVDEDLDSRRNFIKTFETYQNSRYLITQFFQSPFNQDKTVLMFNSDNRYIKDEVSQILDSKFRNSVNGDLVISKLTNEKDNEIFNFDILDKYYIGDFSSVDKFYFFIGNNPYIFVSLSLFLIILITYLLRKTLLLYKVRYHNDADALA